jgi:hypothetical protein
MRSITSPVNRSGTAGRGTRRAWVLAVVLAGAVTLFAAVDAQAQTLKQRNTHSTVAASSTQPLAFGNWTWFNVGSTGTSTPTFTFSSRTPVLLRVTDALCRGDRFKVYDHGFAIFKTSSAPIDPSCDDTPHLDTGSSAWHDPSYSKGKFLLEPGGHRIRIQIIQSPFGSASALVRIDHQPVS